jgi:hypothetical protein
MTLILRILATQDKEELVICVILPLHVSEKTRRLIAVSAGMGARNGNHFPVLSIGE